MLIIVLSFKSHFVILLPMAWTKNPRIWVFSFIFLFLFSFSASLRVASNFAFAEETSTYFLCRNKKMIRTIRVGRASTDNGTCETVYTKSGVDRSVGSGINVSSCLRFAENIRRNLEVADWKCQDITAKSSISPLPEPSATKTE
ncbi:MAG: hypothetical protein IPK68_14820 [Bdellovibrionales bacterium]|nr:hypothetical protein [Bdellovibrionales bacterium]